MQAWVLLRPRAFLHPILSLSLSSSIFSHHFLCSPWTKKKDMNNEKLPFRCGMSVWVKEQDLMNWTVFYFHRLWSLNTWLEMSLEACGVRFSAADVKLMASHTDAHSFSYVFKRQACISSLIWYISLSLAGFFSLLTSAFFQSLDLNPSHCCRWFPGCALFPEARIKTVHATAIWSGADWNENWIPPPFSYWLYVFQLFMMSSPAA